MRSEESLDNCFLWLIARGTKPHTDDMLGKIWVLAVSFQNYVYSLRLSSECVNAPELQARTYVCLVLVSFEGFLLLLVDVIFAGFTESKDLRQPVHCKIIDELVSLG